MSINQNITISRPNILSKYINLNIYFKNVIDTLYGIGSINNVRLQGFYSKNIINVGGNNNLEMLSLYNNKTGVYIFLDNNDIPVYIGVSGTIGGNHHLKDRLQKQFNCNPTNSTLSTNIYDIETSLGNTVVAVDKQLILNYAPKLLVIEVGNLSNPNDVNTSLALEQVLISLFNSKYNK